MLYCKKTGDKTVKCVTGFRGRNTELSEEQILNLGYLPFETEWDAYAHFVTEVDDSAAWASDRHALRIVAPIQLIMDDIGIKMYGWFNVNKLPVVNPGNGYVHLYCNEILPAHTAIIESLQGVITIENRP